MELFDNEEFVPIKGFENYEISRSGKVRNRKTGRIRKNLIDNTGYVSLILYCGKKPKTISIHRLVALHFIQNPNNCPQVNHKDGNKLNNRVENLEWCTHSQNMNHASNMGLLPIGKRNGRAKLTEKQVIEIKVKLKQGFAKKKLARIYGVTPQNIRRISKGKYWSQVTI